MIFSDNGEMVLGTHGLRVNVRVDGLYSKVNNQKDQMTTRETFGLGKMEEDENMLFYLAI